MAKQPSPDRADEPTAPTDAQAFRAAVRDVKPLVHVPLAAGLAKPKARSRPRTHVGSTSELLDESMPLLSSLAADETGSLSDMVTGEGALSFQRAGVRTRELRRLRRGLYPVEAELDLHGLSQTAARDSLAEFLQLNRGAGTRCVRIIHGKGYRSGARGPVLKTAVNLWLRRHMDVAAFVSARPVDGGTGALYVLLRR
ncbi:MAG: Smr/MutS family protein [Pseudomonadota bacterium]|nr:Smr/MutS family protein [Pseudomonadota bacterium]